MNEFAPQKNSSRNFEVPKKHKVFITKSAESDFQTIWEYISFNNPQNATRFLENIEKKIYSLELEPERCPIIPENRFFKDNVYRHLVYKDYRIVFTIRRGTVFIMRIFYGAKLLEIFESDGS